MSGNTDVHTDNSKGIDEHARQTAISKAEACMPKEVRNQSPWRSGGDTLRFGASTAEIDEYLHRFPEGVMFPGIDLHGQDLSGLHPHALAHTDCSYADLRDANLSGLVLDGTNFEGADITGAKFTGADVTGAMFQDAFAEKDSDGYPVRLANGYVPEDAHSDEDEDWVGV